MRKMTVTTIKDMATAISIASRVLAISSNSRIAASSLGPRQSHQNIAAIGRVKAGYAAQARFDTYGRGSRPRPGRPATPINPCLDEAARLHRDTRGSAL